MNGRGKEGIDFFPLPTQTVLWQSLRLRYCWYAWSHTHISVSELLKSYRILFPGDLMTGTRHGYVSLGNTATLICSWRRQWHPTPVLLPGKSHGRRSLVGCSPWSWTRLKRCGSSSSNLLLVKYQHSNHCFSVSYKLIPTCYRNRHKYAYAHLGTQEKL